MAWLASDLVAKVRKAAGLPSSSSLSPEGLTDADLLELGDTEIQTVLVPLLLEVREEFLVVQQDLAFTGTTTRVRVPGRAVGSRVREVRATINGASQPLIRLEPQDVPRYQPQAAVPGYLYGYYLEGEWIVLLPTPSVSGTLNIFFPARPGRLTVTANDFRQITSATVGATTTTLSYTAFSGSAPSPVDVVRGSSGLSPIFLSPSTLSAGLSSATVPNAIGALLKASDDIGLGGLDEGDYLCRHDTTPVIPLPVELHGVLAARMTASVLRQLGRYEDASAEQENSDRLEATARRLLTSRVEAAKRKVVGSFFWRNGGRGVF